MRKVTFLLAIAVFAVMNCTQSGFAFAGQPTDPDLSEWLATELDKPSSPGGIYNSKPHQIVYINFPIESWQTLQVERRESAMTRIACSVPATFPKWNVEFPFVLKFKASSLETDSSDERVKLINEDDCSNNMRAPLLKRYNRGIN